MWLVKQWEREQNVTYIDFNATTWPTEVEPYFCSKRKDETTWELVVDEKYESISWEVVSVTKNETEFKWKPVRAFRIKLVDWEDTIIISPTLTNASKNMLNACLGSIGKEISLRPYLNKAWYPDVSAKFDWGFAPTQFVYNDEKLNDKIWESASEPNSQEVESQAEISAEDIPF